MATEATMTIEMATATVTAATMTTTTMAAAPFVAPAVGWLLHLLDLQVVQRCVQVRIDACAYAALWDECTALSALKTKLRNTLSHT
jgi:hypothetical protein